jgi:hypothetical protein
VSGEPPWRHHHYLRGTIYCGQCGGQLIYTRANVRAGIYEYFDCAGRSTKACDQPHHRVAAIERAVENEYAHVQLDQAAIEQIRREIRAYVAKAESQSEPEFNEIRADPQRLASEERKLLRAHYDARVTEVVSDEEQERIRRERFAERRQRETEIHHEAALEKLEVALLSPRLEEAYRRADANGRQALKPGHLSVNLDRPPGHRSDRDRVALPRDSRHRKWPQPEPGASKPTKFELEGKPRPSNQGRAAERRNPRGLSLFFLGGSNAEQMVARPGFEPGTPRFSGGRCDRSNQHEMPVTGDVCGSPVSHSEVRKLRVVARRGGPRH